MSIWVGTSGYNYPEWKGSFYPEKLPASQMLSYYSERLSTVEINYTYYRMPNAKTLEGWNIATPERFKLTLKAPKRITHDARLKDCAEHTRYFTELAVKLGPKLGRAVVPVAAQFQEGPRAVRRLSCDAARGLLRSLRVQAWLLAVG